MSNYDPVTKIWYSDGRTSLFNPKTSVGEIILYALNLTPDKICEISDDYGTVSTCSEIRNQSIQVAECLKNDFGINFGDVCAIVCKNNPEVSSVVFGCLFIGAAINTLDPTFDQDDFDHILGLTRPKIIFTETMVLGKIQKSIAKLKFDTKIITFSNQEGTTVPGIDTVKSIFESKLDNPHDYHPVRIPDTTKHVAFIICSSGTTGLSKGVCVSHAQIVSQTVRFWPINANDITFAFSSLYWISGVVVLFGGVVMGAVRINTCQPFSPKYVLNLIEKHKITHIFMPPSQIAQTVDSKEIATADLSSIRLCPTGGSYVLEELRNEFMKHLAKDAKVMVEYGMSETACSCTINHRMVPGSVGTVANEHQIMILSEDGEALDVGEKGEILVRQPYPFLGYYGNESATKELQDAEGWIHSGDLGYFDNQGNLYIIGRKKEMIKYLNHQIAPGSIEAIIQEKIGLSQICVVAVEDNRKGTDLPAALIVRPTNFHLTEAEIIEILDTTLTGIKKLRGGIFFVEKLPTTPSGKILRRVAKEIVKDLYEKLLN